MGQSLMVSNYVRLVFLKKYQEVPFIWLLAQVTKGHWLKSTHRKRDTFTNKLHHVVTERMGYHCFICSVVGDVYFLRELLPFVLHKVLL